MYKYQTKPPGKEGFGNELHRETNALKGFCIYRKSLYFQKAMHMPRALCILRKDARRCLAFTSGSALGSMEKGSEG